MTLKAHCSTCRSMGLVAVGSIQPRTSEGDGPMRQGLHWSPGSKKTQASWIYTSPPLMDWDSAPDPHRTRLIVD
jgi:hypothetical protein